MSARSSSADWSSSTPVLLIAPATVESAGWTPRARIRARPARLRSWREYRHQAGARPPLRGERVRVADADRPADVRDAVRTGVLRPGARRRCGRASEHHGDSISPADSAFVRSSRARAGEQTPPAPSKAIVCRAGGPAGPGRSDRRQGDRPSRAGGTGKAIVRNAAAARSRLGERDRRPREHPGSARASALSPSARSPMPPRPAKAIVGERRGSRAEHGCCRHQSAPRVASEAGA
jgi:hypothetical protein